MKKLRELLRANRWFAVVLLLEAAVLASLAASLFGSPYKLQLTSADFSNDYPQIAAVNEDGTALQIWNNSEDFVPPEGKVITFSSAGSAIHSGAYEVTIQYFSCETPDTPTFNALHSAGSLSFSSKGNPSAVRADTVTLDDCHRTVTTRLWVGYGARMQDLTATLTYGEGQLYLYGITLTEQPIYRLTRLVIFVLLAAVLNFVLLLLFARRDENAPARRRKYAVPLTLAGITVAACLPLFSNYLYFGHDIDYHLQRISAMAAELSYGQFPVRMTTDSLNGYGYANSLCYCELFLKLPALLYYAWLPLRTCYQVYIFAVTLSTAIIAYCSFGKITASRKLGLLGAALIIAFLYGFFLSFASGVPAFFERRPAKKYAGQTLLVFRTLTAKLATMGIVMATVSLLFTATLIVEGSGMTFSAMFQSRMEKASAFDLYIGTKNEAHLDAYQDQIRRSVPVTAVRRYAVYQGEDAQVTDYLADHASYHKFSSRDMLMAFSDYAALRAMKGWPAVTLETGEYLIHCQDYLGPSLADYRQPIRISGQTLELAGIETGPLNQNLWDANGHGFVLVVPDELARNCPVSHGAIAAMTEEPVSGEQFAGLCAIRDRYDAAEGLYDTLYSKADQETEAASMSAMVVFPLYYLALVLTMTAATILTVQQLSETDRYRGQFALLRKLGMDRREMRRALGCQFAIYYAMPALPPALIAVPFLLNLGGAVEPGTMTGIYHPAAITALALGLFCLIYLFYILMAYTSLKRNVLPQE